MSNEQAPDPSGGQQPPVPHQSPWGSAPVWNAPGWNTAPQPWPSEVPQSYGAGRNPYGYVAPPKPGVIPLRPLGVGEILDGAFQAARKNAGAVFGSALLVELLILLLTLGLTAWVFQALGAAGLSFETLDAAGAEELFAAIGGPALIGAAGLQTLGLIALLVLQGLLAIPVSRAILNRRTSFALMVRLAKGSVLRLLGLALLYLAAFVLATAGIIAGAVLLVDGLGAAAIPLVVLLVLAVLVAGIWVNIKVTFAPAAIVMEGAGIFAAVARSWQLTGRSWWRIFGVYLLTSLIVGIITSVITTPLSFILGATAPLTNPDDPGALLVAMGPAVLISTAVSAVFTAIGFAFQAGVIALLYIDIRIRREGFDQVLLRELETVPGAESIPGRAAAPDPGR